MMKIKNTGRRRLRIGRTLYIGPGEIVDLSDSDGKYFLTVHGDLVNISPKKRKKVVKPEIIIPEPEMVPLVEDTEKKEEIKDNEVKLDGIE